MKHELTLAQEIRETLNVMAPHVRGRHTALLLQRAADEIEKPRSIKAKPIVWEETKFDVHSEWSESSYGFYITEELREHLEYSFYAAWGEGDGEYFATIEEAKQQCQDEIDRYFGKHGVIE